MTNQNVETSPQVYTRQRQQRTMNTNRIMTGGTTRIEQWQKMLRAMMLTVLGLSAALLAPVYAGTVPDKALQYAADGYFCKALAIIEPLVKDYPQDAEVQSRYGQALAGIGKVDDGIAALKTAVSLKPSNGVYHRLLGEAYGLKAQRAIGVFSVFSSFTAMKSALAEFQLAAQLAPQDLQSHVFLAMYYTMAPGILGGSFDKAYAEADIIAKLDAIQGIQVRASIAGKKDDTATGVALLKEAVAKDTTAGSLMELGLFYTEAKRYNGAFKAFRDAKAKYPKAYGAWYQIGRVAGFAKTNYDEGIKSLKQYLAFDDLPDNVFSFAWAHFRLGNIYEYQGYEDLARAEYQLANNLNDDNEDLKSKLEKAMSRLD